MGKGVIVSGGPEGLYIVGAQIARARIDAEIASLELQIIGLDPDIERLTEVLELENSNVEAYAITLSGLIKDWRERIENGEDEDPEIDPGDEDQEGAADPSGLVAAHNALRAGKGLDPLSENPYLTAAAQAHADWIAPRGTVSHSGDGGSSPRERIIAAGYPSGPGLGTGENVGGGLASVEEIMSGWQGSPPHWANIIEPRFTEIGVGYRFLKKSKHIHYWVVTFGRPGEV